MLSSEVVHLGGSLSTVLIAMPYWRDASQRVSWQAATATVADSCDRMVATLVLWLGQFDNDGFKILSARIRITSIWHFLYFINIQPLIDVFMVIGQ
jgi:hypothetical protein